MSYNKIMKKIPYLFLVPLLLGGCFNDRGISARYYNDCEEYYDLQGYYHKECDKNLVDYADIKEAFKPASEAGRGSVQ